MVIKNVFCYLFIASIIGFTQLTAQTLRIEVSEVTETTLLLQVKGDSGEFIVVELSGNLLEWEDLKTGELVNGRLEVLDSINSVSDLKRYYRARISTMAGLLSDGDAILAGDTLTILISNGSAGADWEWSVNGIAGGDSTVGLIRASPFDPSMAFYTAPLAAPDDPVSLSAQDLNAETVASKLVSIKDVPVDLVIVPGPTTLGVGGTLSFQAGLEVAGIGFIPFKRAIWKVNGLIGGTLDLGTISLGGLYTAPPVLPDTLPAPIEVGYSLTVPQNPLKSVSLKLVDLEVTPGQTVRFFETEGDTDPQTQLSATLHFSDGTTEASPINDTNWDSDLVESATVDATGLITVLEEPGNVTITAKNAQYNVSDTASLKAREPLYFSRSFRFQ